jgi:hypothetical protein
MTRIFENEFLVTFKKQFKLYPMVKMAEDKLTRRQVAEKLAPIIDSFWLKFYSPIKPPKGLRHCATTLHRLREKLYVDYDDDDRGPYGKTGDESFMLKTVIHLLTSIRGNAYKASISTLTELLKHLD